MKKFFTLFAAVLMAGSMIAKDVTFTDIGSSSPASDTKDGVTLTVSWTSNLSKYVGFTWMSTMTAGSVTVSVTAPGKTITNFAIQGGNVSYSGTDTTYTFNVGKRETKQFDRVVVTLEDEAVDLTFESEELRYYYYDDETLSWNLTWQGEEQSSETHKLALCRTTNLANKFGHFTTADFDLVESYFSGVGAEGEYVTAIDVTLTETEYGFTMSGYVVAADGVTYNLAGEYAAPKATPSVTTFTTLSDLDGLTITLSGVAVQFAGQDGSIYLTNNESETHIYGRVENYTFNNNVLTIEGFVYDAEEMDPLPEEGKDLLIMSDGVFEGYYVLPLCTIHFDPAPSALENNAAGVKATKALVNGKVVIRRGDKHFNLVGAEL